VEKEIMMALCNAFHAFGDVIARHFEIAPPLSVQMRRAISETPYGGSARYGLEIARYSR
jgi:hypothetical protein